VPLRGGDTMRSSVAEQAYQTARLGELERADGWAPIRAALDVQAFGVNAWTAHEAGATLIPTHDEAPSGHEELFVVTAGHARFTVDGAELDAPAGEIVFVRDPAVSRGAVAVEADTTVLTVGATAGEAFRPRSWEVNRDVIAHLDAGRHAEARELLLDALDRFEDRETVLYNLACAEAQLGQTDAALRHLAEALRLRPAFAEPAAEDDDLAPLRTDPRFGELTAGD
jgi:tetratricopeptide (TPR) repeat protein